MSSMKNRIKMVCKLLIPVAAMSSKCLIFIYFKPEDLSVNPTLKGGYPSREENTLLFQQPIYFSLNLLEKNCIKQCTNNRHALGRPLAIQALTNLDSWSALTSKTQGPSAALCISAATAALFGLLRLFSVYPRSMTSKRTRPAMSLVSWMTPSNHARHSTWMSWPT